MEILVIGTTQSWRDAAAQLTNTAVARKIPQLMVGSYADIIRDLRTGRPGNKIRLRDLMPIGIEEPSLIPENIKKFRVRMLQLHPEPGDILLLNYIDQDAECLIVVFAGGKQTLSQDQINELLVQLSELEAKQKVRKSRALTIKHPSLSASSKSKKVAPQAGVPIG